MAVKRRIKRNASGDVMTWGECVNEFLEEKSSALSKSTVDGYEYAISVFQQFHHIEDDMDINELTQSHFFKWINWMKNEKTSTHTIKHYIGSVRVFIYWCMDHEYIKEPFEIKMIEVQEARPKVYEDEELDALLEKPKRNATFGEWRCYAITNFIMATGARASTITNMKISDLNFAKREIYYTHTKTKIAQTVPMSSSLETVLREYIKIWRSNIADGWLFCNVGEEKLTVNALHTSFAKYCANRGVKGHSIHQLRHSFSREWIRNNGNVFALQQMLGHTTLDMSRKYVRLYANDLKQGFDAYSPLDNIKKNSKRTQVVKRSK